MVQETEYQFDEDGKQKTKESALSGFGKFIWNSNTKEFCGRDGASWGKISLCYAIFYACLGSFFIGMLAVFMAIMPVDKPTYYGYSSTMNARVINPGLGFRPQIDVEDSFIHFSTTQYEGKNGYKQFLDNLQNFLDHKYKDQPEDDSVVPCGDGDDRRSDLIAGKSCKYDYKKVFAESPCTKENKFQFGTSKPCILIKLNKIVSWEPKLSASYNSSIEIRCFGETSADKDNLKGITYHSEGNINSTEHGLLHKKYFPFYAQKSYRSPFVFAQFDIPSNTMVNIECKAFADNIDNDDRMNRRGMTKFTMFSIEKK